MVHGCSRFATIAVLAAAAWLAVAGEHAAQGYGAPGWASPEPNYYAMPPGNGGLTAALYPCPRPTPPLIGQTYITYRPLAPHELLYAHYQHYTTCNDGCHSHADHGHVRAPSEAVAVAAVADQRRARPAHAGRPDLPVLRSRMS